MWFLNNKVSLLYFSKLFFINTLFPCSRTPNHLSFYIDIYISSWVRKFMPNLSSVRPHFLNRTIHFIKHTTLFYAASNRFGKTWITTNPTVHLTIPPLIMNPDKQWVCISNFRSIWIRLPCQTTWKYCGFLTFKEQRAEFGDKLETSSPAGSFLFDYSFLLNIFKFQVDRNLFTLSNDLRSFHSCNLCLDLG